MSDTPHDPPFDQSFSPPDDRADDMFPTVEKDMSPAAILARVEEVTVPMLDDKNEIEAGIPIPYIEGTITRKPDVGINPKDAVAGKKPDLTLIPPAALLHESMGMMDGGKKYGPYNWRDNAVLARVYIAAAMRHLQQLLDGEDFDPISGVHHAGHVRCCMGIYLDAFETGNLVDDRPKPGVAGDLIRRFEDKKNFQKDS